jgi:hypothetical protein
MSQYQAYGVAARQTPILQSREEHHKQYGLARTDILPFQMVKMLERLYTRSKPKWKPLLLRLGNSCLTLVATCPINRQTLPTSAIPQQRRRSQRQRRLAAFQRRLTVQKYLVLEEGLTPLEGSNEIRRRLRDYRRYRLHEMSLYALEECSKTKSKLESHVARSIVGGVFDGTDPASILALLKLLAETACQKGLTEGDLFAVLPEFLTGEAYRTYRTAMNGNPSPILSYCSAVNRLLDRFANEDSLAEAARNTFALRQAPKFFELRRRRPLLCWTFGRADH